MPVKRFFHQLCQGSLPFSRSLIGRPGTKKQEAGEFKVYHKLQPLRSSSRGPRQASNYPVKKCDLGFIGSRGRELLKDFHRHPYSISLMIASWRRPERYCMKISLSIKACPIKVHSLTCTSAVVIPAINSGTFSAGITSPDIKTFILTCQTCRSAEEIE